MSILNDMNDVSDKISSADEMVEQMSFMIFGAVVTTTKAFGDVEIKLNSESQRVFISITLRWFARIKRLESFRKYWLAKAERRAQKYVPKGWRMLCYYKQGEGNE
jgi:hypothetical protein